MKNQTAAWISLLLLFVYLLSYSGVYHAVDEMSALAVTESLLTRQWSVNQMEWDQSRTPPQNEVGVDGKLYSKKGLGVSLAALPLFAVGKQWAAVGAVQMALLLNPLLTALLAFVFFHLATALGYDERTATIGTLSLGLGTLLWPFARTIFSESLAALGLCLALFGVVGMRSALVDKRGLLLAFSAGSGAAILLLARTANAVVLPVVGLYLGYLFLLDWRKNGRISRLLPPAIAFGLPIALSLLAVVLYNYLRFHTLLTFPLAPFERFSNPLGVGLAGLLLSPGKGLVWYVPLVWLSVPALRYWIKTQQLAEALLAIGVVVATLLLYAQWYDWPGGRAWGPRMLVMTMPALVMFCLPLLSAWGRVSAPRWQRGLLILVLSLSVLVQCLGVLVNFERQEGLDMQSGLTFDQLLWDVAHAPLLTYWTKIASASADPLWLQPFFWRNPGWLLAGLLSIGGILLALLRFAWPSTGATRLSRWTLPVAGLLLTAFALGLVVAAQADPRWHERSADPRDNLAVVEFLAQNGNPADLVLLDLLPENDLAGRTSFWMNWARRPAHTIGWLRKPVMSPAAVQQLAGWIKPYSRVWLALQATDENVPGSTTEHWLDQRAYRGRQTWIGSQRVVEYLLPLAAADVKVTSGSLLFGADLAVTYTVQPGQAAGQQLVRLAWARQPSPTLRVSIQALDRDGRLVTQVDRAPGQLTNSEHAFLDQVGIQFAEPIYTLIIKMYQAEGGAVVPVQATDALSAEYAVLFTNR